MKNTNYTLKIDAPCKQSWDSMTENDVGKFCSNCSKTVVDFTKMKDQEIIHFLRNSQDKPCARLSKSQSKILIENNSLNQSKFYKFLASVLILGASNYTSAINPISIQTKIESSPTNTVLPKTQNIALHSDSTKQIIIGKVLEKHTNEPIPFASIIIKNTAIKANSNIDGEFSLEIPDSLLGQDLTLIISTVYYESFEYSFNSNQLPLTMDFYLSPEEMILIGEVEMIEEKK